MENSNGNAYTDIKPALSVVEVGFPERNRRVIVVEDDQSVVRMLRFSLRRAGFEVVEVATGGDALRFLDDQPTEAVVLDLGLPDGREGAVLDWLHQHQQMNSSSPAWVVISALDLEEATRRYGPLGSHFLAKPFDPWELVRMLEELLSAKEV